ncbi:hypothetical protein [Azorhizobium sp. AG788]|uniref:hypothetical protein n=1 Tax=Azorhizobium sp. AG788 TaxID=2183897 RepID=UPI003139B6F9
MSSTVAHSPPNSSAGATRRTARQPAQVGSSALRASLVARLGVAAVLSAVMWVAVALVVHL